MSEPPVQELGARLAGEAGLGAPQAVEPMTGGRNNRVFRLVCRDGAAVVLKCYHHDPLDPRDRLKAEWSFLSYARARGVCNVPEPIVQDPAAHAALYGFVTGRRADAVDEGLAGQAAEFVVAINGPPHDAATLAPASEACFSLGKHLATVDRRVARLADLDADTPLVDQARAFVEGKLVAAWDATKAAVLRQAAARAIPLTRTTAHAIVSPSDFGFHNALIDAEGRASFLDFEYAGRDDPAKLICDFFCQPELPVPLHFYADFIRHLAVPLGLQEEDLWRARLLLDVYRIKWVCIMLNGFSSVGARRRAFARAHDDEARAALRLNGAERYLSLVASELPETAHGVS